MNTRLLVLGLNIIAVSCMIMAYGFTINDTGLVGLSTSSGIMGGVLLVFSFTTAEGIVNAFNEYSVLMTNGLTTVMEDLDLLDAKPSITSRRGELYLLLSKASPDDDVDPGIGTLHGLPYIAIPIGSVLQDASALENFESSIVEPAISSILIDDMGLCSRVSVEVSNRFIKVTLTGVSKEVEKLLGYPINPLTALTMTALARLTKTDVRLVNMDRVVGGYYMVFEVKSSAQEPR
ncbi:MAG: hypothetical protein N3E36_00560 [Sulfolobales archaeon]|nr:hypothetical protein [Sulfolobales archaeon]